MCAKYNLPYKKQEERIEEGQMYKNLMQGWKKHIDFLLLDTVCLELAFLIAYFARHGLEKRYMLLEQYLDMQLVIVLLSFCAAFFLSSYRDVIQRGYIMELRQSIFHCVFVTLGLIVWMFVIKESMVYSRFVVLLMCPLSIVIVYAGRLGLKKLVRNNLKKKKILREILVVTTKERAKETIRQLEKPYSDYRISACVLYDDSEKSENEIGNIPVVADKEGVINYLQKHVIDEVFIDLPGKEKDSEKLMNKLINMGVVVHVNLVSFSSDVENKEIHNFAGFMVLSTGMKFATIRQLFMKRVMDICGALVGLVLAGIAFIIFGPIIKKQSPGPILFSQQRVGRNGRPFKIYKFRTMNPNAEQEKKELEKYNKMDGLMFKMDNDPRIIPIGHFLRRTSIDELPQFWNVLKGEMSLVGTRPPTMDEYEKYEPSHKKRLAIKPGLTGMWQANGRSEIIDFEEVVALDAKYITEWRLALDIKLIWKTIVNVVKRKGAV